MGIEPPKPNGFRAAILAGADYTPLVKGKTRRADPSSPGLASVGVAREEGRRSDQRGGDRHQLNADQAIVRRNGHDQLVDLLNLSRGGAMVGGRIKAKLWDRLELVLGDCGAVECAVRWIKGDRLGLEFAHETRIDCDDETLGEVLREAIRNSFPDEVEAQLAAIEPEAPAQKRAATRHPLIWSGILHHDYEWEVARIRNISASGALVECPADLPEGVLVYLDIEGAGRVAATVSWSRGNQCGLAFQEPFDLRLLSKSTPEIATPEWTMPDFLRRNGGAEEPSTADRWDRATIGELSRSLGG